MQLPIIKYRNLWFLISCAIVVASAVMLALFPLKFGIDFTGGSLLEVQFSGDRPLPADLSDVLTKDGYREATAQTIGDKGMILRMADIDEARHQELLKSLGEKFGEVKERRFESIGPTVGSELRRKAFWSVGMVFLAIALYIAYAFRKISRPVSSWKYGLITLIAALFHDGLLPLGLFALLGKLYNAEINSGLVAAILTVLGYSVHDTIVVFDRIRENLLKVNGSFEQVVERSVNETLARSINTSLTALFPLAAIYILGGETLKNFALVLIVGITAGAYSSIFLASPLLVVFQKRSQR